MKQEPDDTPDLSAVTSEQLMDELERRAAAFVIGFDPMADEQPRFYTRRSGDVLRCVGLVRKLEMCADKALADSTVSDEDEDER